MQQRDLSRLMIIAMLMLGGAVLFDGQSVFGQLRIVGSISGTVVDSAGAGLPNAKVVLKDSKTGITRETTASDHGTFLFPDLANGMYEITVTVTGFQTSILPNISV